MNQLLDTLGFIGRALKLAWPFILVSIPLSVAVNLSGTGERVQSLIGRRPVVFILLATLFGALSPLCACTVIPVIFSHLTAGVPLGPVMAFWIASPSMDPEIFFLSAGTLGWNLAVWRLAATFLLSLTAGFTAYFLSVRGYFSTGILRERPSLELQTWGNVIKKLFQRRPVPEGATACCTGVPLIVEKIAAGGESLCCSTVGESSCGCGGSSGDVQMESLWFRILQESGKSLLFVGKFLIVVYLLEALIVLYVPEESIITVLGGKGAALAFLISGPMTTLPAMSAVFGIAKSRVFGLYLGIAFLGALLFGILYLMLGA
ncbi:MAG: permease [Spirochaetales bacterium]|nr:permease [Spirochaetales bacterium]